MDVFNELTAPRRSSIINHVPISELNGMTTLGTLGLCGPKERITRGPGVVHPARPPEGCAADGPRVSLFIQQSRFRKTGNVGRVTHEQDSGAPTWF